MDVLTIATGDIVASSRLSPGELENAMAALAAATRLVWRWKKAAEPARFQRFRGDGWQAVLPDGGLSLRTALFLRAHLRRHAPGIDTRISIAIGPGSLPADGSLGSAGGPAFELSGRGLDAMGRAARFAIAWADQRSDAPALRAVFALADEISRRWSVRQAEVFCHMLEPEASSQSAIAAGLGISQQMVAKHLAAGGAWALQEAMEMLESPAECSPAHHV